MNLIDTTNLQSALEIGKTGFRQVIKWKDYDENKNRCLNYRYKYENVQKKMKINMITGDTDTCTVPSSLQA